MKKYCMTLLIAFVLCISLTFAQTDNGNDEPELTMDDITMVLVTNYKDKVTVKNGVTNVEQVVARVEKVFYTPDGSIHWLSTIRGKKTLKAPFGMQGSGITLVYWLCILSTLLCIIYGIINWNKGGEGEEKEIREELKWEQHEMNVHDGLEGLDQSNGSKSAKRAAGKKKK